MRQDITVLLRPQLYNFNALSWALGSPRCPVPLCPTLSKLCKPQSETFRTCPSETAPTKPTQILTALRESGCVRNVLKKGNISDPLLKG